MVPPGSRAARVRRAIRLVVRGSALLVVLLVGLVAALVGPLLGPSVTAAVQRVWAAAVLSACGVHVRHRGPAIPPVPPGALVVANHVSWLDVFALHAVAPVRMLAKTEVRQWPVLGIMAARAGTVFLDRDRLRDLPGAVAGLADALRAGTPVGVFAEGTTRCGRDLGPFRPAAFQAAYEAGAPVVPVAVRYGRLTGDGRGVDATAAFIGDDTLAASLLRVLAVPDVVVDVTTCAIVDTTTLPAGRARADARRALARGCADAVAAVLPPDPLGHPAARRAPTPLPTTPELEHVA
ncbi:lysophospholipid acyltransferase family protein [Actinomycetospora straminea]|uniref:1-acyl-sn-glycerol-3-phosphate acyltransferase n=1 Tax=Actinomycetospora straminea TaxID=663607 RepID=A0ABP9EA50_9PSEU